MRTNTVRARLWLGVGIAASAAVVAATGALGVSGSDTITTIAGTGKQGFSGDGGPATRARLTVPSGVAVDGQGNVYVFDRGNYRVRKVSRRGTITTIAGTGKPGYSGDGGKATAAQLYGPANLSGPLAGVAVDGQGNVYIGDTLNNRVRKVSPDGRITTFAGTGKARRGEALGDGGPATSAQLYSPSGVAVDKSGNVYIADTLDQRVRKVDASGTITTIAGTSNIFAPYGDGGLATATQLSQPNGIAVDGRGNVYIAELLNPRVRKVSPDGTITSVAGTGGTGFSGDGGPATSAQLYGAVGLAVDSQGNLYIGDTGNDRVRKVSPGGKISTIAGTGKIGFSGDGGPASRAKLYIPTGLAVDRSGNLYIADAVNYRVRKVGRRPR